MKKIKTEDKKIMKGPGLGKPSKLKTEQLLTDASFKAKKTTGLEGQPQSPRAKAATSKEILDPKKAQLMKKAKGMELKRVLSKKMGAK